MRKLMPLGGAGGGAPIRRWRGKSDGMEARVTSLDKRFDRFEAKLDSLIRDVAQVKRRVSAMPSTWQLIGIVLAVLGAAFAIIRFGVSS